MCFSLPFHLTPCFCSQGTSPRTPVLPAVNSSVLEPAEGTQPSFPLPPHTYSQAPLPQHGHPASSGVSSIHWQAWRYHVGLFHISLFRTSPFPNRVLASSLQNQRAHWNALFCFSEIKEQSSLPKMVQKIAETFKIAACPHSHPSRIK